MSKKEELTKNMLQTAHKAYDLCAKVMEAYNFELNSRFEIMYPNGWSSPPNMLFDSKSKADRVELKLKDLYLKTNDKFAELLPQLHLTQSFLIESYYKLCTELDVDEQKTISNYYNMVLNALRDCIFLSQSQALPAKHKKYTNPVVDSLLNKIKKPSTPPDKENST